MSNVEYEPVYNIVVWLAAVPVPGLDPEDGCPGLYVLRDGDGVVALHELGGIVVHVDDVDQDAAGAGQGGGPQVVRPRNVKLSLPMYGNVTKFVRRIKNLPP